MLENIHSIDTLVGMARKKVKSFDVKAVDAEEVEKYQNQGWEFSKKLKISIQLKKEKPHQIRLTDKAWLMFYKMGFPSLSGEGGAELISNSKEENSYKFPIDVVAIDREVALFAICKSSADPKKRPQLQKELQEFAEIKESLVKSIKAANADGNVKKQIIQIIFLNHIILSDNDKECAKKLNIILFDENDLAYYENLVGHIGPAAKYQVLSDMLPGKAIPGLSIKIPAIKSKMGDYSCYTFSISPEYLLKVSYVSHRSKGKASDVDTYQRMLTKSRLKKIKEYIEDNGIFPTNIVLNFEKGRLNFQKTKQEHEGDQDLDTGILGWLEIKPAYKSAWIIDGQHRLFAYSGERMALKSKLTVLAFEGLKPSMQAELFIDINAKQKSVKQSLLQELYAELNWDSDEPSVRISAIISKTIQDLNNDPQSILYQRIQSTDGQKDELKCITLNSLFGQIEKKGFFIEKEKAGTIVQYGPLWGGDDNRKTLKRATFILNKWLNTIVDKNKEWWDLGSAEGGGLAMNDGISAILAVLRSVFEFLESKGHKLVDENDSRLWEQIAPYAGHLASYLATLDESQRKSFRDRRGVAGVTFRTRQCQEGMKRYDTSFSPEGLDVWIKEQKEQTNKKAKEIIDRLELLLQKFIIEELQLQYGIEGEKWWYEGIPQNIRKSATERMEEDKNSRGGKEYYLFFIDYKKIILDNWDLFEHTFAQGKANASKEKRMAWIDSINETRKITAHSSSGKTVSFETYTKLTEIDTWLQKQIAEEPEPELTA